MKRPNPTTIEATLDNLYANELNVELSWDHKRGFRAVLGNAPLTKKTFPTSDKAVSWLKEQALRHFTRAEFPTKGPGTAGRETILDHFARATSPARFRGFGMAASTPLSASRNGPRHTPPPALAKQSTGCAIRRSSIIPTANLPTNMPGSAFRKA
jgi:hypothetical protein